MTYKALILDIDGTVIVNGGPTILPSKKVSEAIQRASKLVHVGLATGRPLPLAKTIFDHLKLTGPCILNDGTQIYDPQSKEFIYEIPLSKESVIEICRIAKKFPVRIYLNDGDTEPEYKGKILKRKIFVVFIPKVTTALADEIIKELAVIKGITAYKGLDWEPGMEYVAACDIKGTKQHGIFEVAKFLHIDSKEIIGVGDGYNDFPLLMACGMKIAMGNAVPELKAIADFVAPTVEDDGVATIIEKFILSQ